MTCCGGKKSDDALSDEIGGQTVEDHKCVDDIFGWRPTLKSAKKIAYVRQLETRYESLQSAYFNLSVELARLQACLQQIVQADACHRAQLIDDVKRKGFQRIDCNALPTLEQCSAAMGKLCDQQHLLMVGLRQQIGSFEEAIENLEDKEICPAVEQEAPKFLISQTSLKSSRSKTLKCCFPSVKVTKYDHEVEAAAASTGRDNITEIPKETKLNKLKNSLKLAGKPTKVEATKDSSSAENLGHKTVSKKTLKHATNKKGLSTETLSSGQSIISTRSASFKELKAKYQQHPGAGK